jgi:hypothetical protein
MAPSTTLTSSSCRHATALIRPWTPLDRNCRHSSPPGRTSDFLFSMFMRLPRALLRALILFFFLTLTMRSFPAKYGQVRNIAPAAELTGFILPQVAWRRAHAANHNAVPDDHCIAELFAPCSARGTAGAEAGKRNIPGTACLRLVRAHVITADEAPAALIELSWTSNTRVPQGVAPCLDGPTADGPDRQSSWPLTAHGDCGHALVVRLCFSIFTIGCVRSTACQRQLQPAVRRFATWDRLKSRHSVNVTYTPAIVLPDRLNESCRSLAFPARCKLHSFWAL